MKGDKSFVAHVHARTSTTHPDKPEKKDPVRMKIILAGNYIEACPEHNGAKMTAITHQDVNGYIP